jgi:hypothetical protein
MMMMMVIMMMVRMMTAGRGRWGPLSVQCDRYVKKQKHGRVHRGQPIFLNSNNNINNNTINVQQEQQAPLPNGRPKDTLRNAERFRTQPRSGLRRR